MASGNIASSGIVSGQYLQVKSTSVAGASCSPDGLISKDDKGALLICQSGKWTGSDSKQGALCGFSSDDHLSGNINVYLCKGYNPRKSCPAGYVQSRIFQADSNFLYSCVITENLSGE